MGRKTFRSIFFVYWIDKNMDSASAAKFGTITFSITLQRHCLRVAVEWRKCVIFTIPQGIKNVLVFFHLTFPPHTIPSLIFTTRKMWKKYSRCLVRIRDKRPVPKEYLDETAKCKIKMNGQCLHFASQCGCKKSDFGFMFGMWPGWHLGTRHFSIEWIFFSNFQCDRCRMLSPLVGFVLWHHSLYHRTVAVDDINDQTMAL